MNARFPRSLMLTSTLLAVGSGCAGGLPAVVSSNPAGVSVEFELEGSVTEAGQIAAKECEKHGKLTEFVTVDTKATPKSRIANFRCVDPTAAVGAGPGDSYDK